ncbi:MAG: hypothetical protein HY514_02925 [Candidatus Aenigmarchaeota archaeon]|nr:hypothetical protein [Candidatus Aenigmarchaeota archaeon]
MKDVLRNKMLAIALLLIGIIFIVEASAVMYVLGLLPPFILQSNPQVAQFVSVGWGYGMLKLLVGLIAAVSAGAIIFSR